MNLDLDLLFYNLFQINFQTHILVSISCISISNFLNNFLSSGITHKSCNYSRMDPGTESDRDILDKNKNLQYIRNHHKNRKQKYDWRGQLHSITHNHQLGQKLPMVVKFPFISQEFENIDEDHEYAKHRSGIYNGLFVVPKSPSSEFEIPSVVISKYDPVPEFFKTPCFRLLDYAFNLVYRKILLKPSTALNPTQCTSDYMKDAELKNHSN